MLASELRAERRFDRGSVQLSLFEDDVHDAIIAQYLPLVLWLEADRMASLDVSEAKFRTELEVVKEERRMRFENQPYGLLPEIIDDHAFTTHPYKHETIGSIAEVLLPLKGDIVTA